MKQKLFSILSVAAVIIAICLTGLFLILTNRIPGLPASNKNGAAADDLDRTELSLVVRDYSELEALDKYNNLQRLDLSGSTCYSDIRRYMQSRPDLDITFCLILAGDMGECRINNRSEYLELDDCSLLNSIRAYSSYLPKLKEVCLRQPGCSVNVMNAFCDGMPEVKVTFLFAPEWERIARDAETLDLSGFHAEYLNNAAAFLKYMNKLEYVKLTAEDGTNTITLDGLKLLQETAPQVLWDYSLELFGVNINVNCENLEFYGNNTGYIYDSGMPAIEEVLPVLTRLKRLYFEFCEIEYETLAQFREKHPEITVAWRIVFGPYSCTTDREMIYADGSLNTELCYNLRYCAGCKYLDLGHNPDLESIEFVRGMPNLEIAIFAGDKIYDLSPLSECKRLRYLELFSTSVFDISPLSACTELEHLNISNIFISDISPLYSLTKLKRMWCTMNRIPKAQQDEIQSLLPDCEFCFSGVEPTGNHWRFESDGSRTEVYDELYRIFGYENWRDYISYW